MSETTPIIDPAADAFIQFIERHRQARHWSFAELARRAGLTQPEVSRVVHGLRMPTLRHVKGLATAFSGAAAGTIGEPVSFADWVAILIDMAENNRVSARTKPTEVAGA